MYVGDYSPKPMHHACLIQKNYITGRFGQNIYSFKLYFFGYRAGYKLEAAIEQLDVNVAGKVALDSGLCTGGFTDCLLQYGASFVYGVDVGYRQAM